MAMLFVFLIFSFVIGIGNCQTINVNNFGAVGDGKTDDSQAFLKAWNALCTSTSPNPTMEIPSGKTFLVKQLNFTGPCKSNTINVKFLGNIVAPNDNTWTECNNGCWMCFSNVAGLTVNGNGIIDGNGAAWWGDDTPRECAPAVMSFHKCDKLTVDGIISHNSPGNHFGVNNCEEVILSHIQLIAPEDSPNTDGIDISATTSLQILNSFIGTGDDCIAINGGTSRVNITSLTCGPGHGISVGSLGKDGRTETVEEIHVKHSILNGTTNGARIKTWEGGKGSATGISFEDITLTNVQNPIFIDQHYCPQHNCPSKETSALQIDNVIFSGFRGTSASEVAINLNCSNILPCTHITLNDINITPSNPGKTVKAACNNAKGSSSSTSPPVACLSPNNLELSKIIEYFI